jgi:hypothetical protein
MGFDDHLTSTQLHDCHGRVSHTLTLLADGMVRIDFAHGRSATVDPEHRRNLTPQVPVGPALFDQAAALQPT